jgi:hypothetical protein
MKDQPKVLKDSRKKHQDDRFIFRCVFVNQYAVVKEQPLPGQRWTPLEPDQGRVVSPPQLKAAKRMKAKKWDALNE